MDPLPRHSSEPTPDTPISVGALLRREGRGRHSLDRPLLPRGHSRPIPGPVQPPRHGMRKSVAAAGALFAAGAVFGGTVLQEALLEPDADDPAPGVDGTGPASAQPGGDRSAAQPGGSPFLLATEATTLRPEPSLARASGADIGRAALAPTDVAAPAPGDPAPVPADDGAVPVVAGPGGPAPVGVAPDDAAPGAAAPGATAPGPTAPGATAPGATPPSTPTPGDPTPAVGPPGPGGLDPGGPDPEGPAPAAPGPQAAGSVELPDLGTAPVTVPGVQVPGTPLSTPSVTVSEAAVVPPDLRLTVAADGLDLDASAAAVTTPDLAVDEVDAGPLGLSGTSAALPDLAVGAEQDRPLLAVGDEPELTVPAVEVSPASLTTPDLRLGDATVEIPDLATPVLSTPAVPVLGAVGGLLGG